LKLSDITDIAVSGLHAQRVRMVVTASNLANAESTRGAGGAPGPYRRRDPVFAAEPLDRAFSGSLARKLQSVRVSGVVEDQREPIRRHEPAHPDANDAGFVLLPRVNTVEEMANMISASRSFEANLVLMRKVRDMGDAALRMGRA